MFFILHHDRLNMIDIHTFENKTAAYYTLGCKLNFAETSTLGKILEENGIRKVRSGEKADICVVNTCSVTELADKKCRQTIRKIARQHPERLSSSPAATHNSNPKKYPIFPMSI